jgi:hypothetical protein
MQHGVHLATEVVALAMVRETYTAVTQTQGIVLTRYAAAMKCPRNSRAQEERLVQFFRRTAPNPQFIAVDTV